MYLCHCNALVNSYVNPNQKESHSVFKEKIKKNIFKIIPYIFIFTFVISSHFEFQMCLWEVASLPKYDLQVIQDALSFLWYHFSNIRKYLKKFSSIWLEHCELRWWMFPSLQILSVMDHIIWKARPPTRPGRGGGRIKRSCENGPANYIVMLYFDLVHICA